MSVAPTSPLSRRRLWFHSVIYRLFTVDRAPLFSAKPARAVLFRAGARAAITRSAPRNASPVPDPKRTAKLINGVGKGSAADDTRCYGQPRSYLTGWKTVHCLIFVRLARHRRHAPAFPLQNVVSWLSSIPANETAVFETREPEPIPIRRTRDLRNAIEPLNRIKGFALMPQAASTTAPARRTIAWRFSTVLPPRRKPARG